MQGPVGLLGGVCTEEVLAHPAVPQVFAETPFFREHNSSVTSLERDAAPQFELSVLGKTMHMEFSDLFLVNRLNLYKLFLTSGKLRSYEIFFYSILYNIKKKLNFIVLNVF